MRGRVAGLLLALILLAVAVPASLGCFGSPPGAGAHPQLLRGTAYTAVHDQAVHDQCADRSTPAQTPYIENYSGNGGRDTVTPRGVNAAIDTSASSLAATVSAQRQGVAADDTGPPLWLRTCVSRT